MAIELVKEYFKKFGMEDKVLEFDVSSATVELAAKALNTTGAKIAKTLSFNDKNEDNNCILVVTAGDAKIDNKKFKSFFSQKAKMLTPDEVEEYTNHQVGGVCPFANPTGVKTYIDISIKRFDFIYPACGSSNSAIKLTPEELFKYASAIEYIDVCKDWE